MHPSRFQPQRSRIVGWVAGTLALLLGGAFLGGSLQSFARKPTGTTSDPRQLRGPGDPAMARPEAREVRLDVVVLEVRPGLVPAFAFPFLKRSGKVLFGRGGARSPFAGTLASPEDVDDFLGFLRALENEGLAKRVAQPTLVTPSGQPVSFSRGGERAIPVPPGLGSVGVQFEEFGTRLNLLPIVRGEHKLHLEAEPEVSHLDPSAGVVISGTVVPGRVTNRIHVQDDLRPGQTLLLGGLITEATLDQADASEGMRQWPFIGSLFSKGAPVGKEVEVVILITPRF